VSALAATAAKKQGLRRMANAKSIGWAIYASGFAIWFFGYLSTGHAPLFDWDAAAPWWISSFVPNLEAELGLALMFTSMIPTYWRAGVVARVMRGATISLLWFARLVADPAENRQPRGGRNIRRTINPLSRRRGGI
jgi:hypothetical protein